MLDEHERGIKCMYRTREERQTEIEKRGGKKGKDSWFRKKNDNQREKRTSVLRVPYTGGELKKAVNGAIRRNDQPEGTSTDAYEDSGDRLLHALVRPDPFPTEDCGRITCQTVCGDIHGKCKNTCWQNHINYTVYCKECETQGANDCKRHIYVGESSRGCHTRFLQEKKQCNPSSQGFMWNHVVEHHGGDTRTEFVVRRECIDSDPLRRVVREAVRIEKYMKDPSVVLMNGKEEHFGPQMVRPSFGMNWMD